MVSSIEPRPSALQLRRLLQLYASALRNDPSDLVLRTKLAEVLRLLGRNTEAISLYRAVAWAHGVSGNLGQAIMICKLILELDPTHSATQEMLARLYASKQVREQKQAIPVVNVGGRWVADPRHLVAGPAAAAPGGTAGGAAGAVSSPIDDQGPPSPRAAAAGASSLSDARAAEVTVWEGPAHAPHRRELPGLVAARRPSYRPSLPGPDDELPEYAREPTRVGDDDDDVEPEAEPCHHDEEAAPVSPPADEEPPPLPKPESEERPLPALQTMAEQQEASLRDLILLSPAARSPAAARGRSAEVAPAGGGDAAAPPRATTPMGRVPSELVALTRRPWRPTLRGTGEVQVRSPRPEPGGGEPASLTPARTPLPTAPMTAAVRKSLLQMDAEQALANHSPGRGYASIQREVRSALEQQVEREMDPQEVEAERDLLDTLREAPAVTSAAEKASVERFQVPFPLFSDLDTPAFLAVIRRLDRRVMAAGEWVFREGDRGDSLYLVSSGVLQVLKEADRPVPLQLARLGGGSFFGEFGLLTDGRRHASVRCQEESELLELRREVLVELCQEHPSIVGTLRTFYQQRLISTVMATSPIFQAVSSEERGAVLARFELRRFAPGQVIIEEAGVAAGFFVILVGTARVSCRAEDGSEVELGVLSEGNYFGEMSLLSGLGPAATVRAGGIIEALVLSPQDFYELSAEHPAIWTVVQAEAERRRADTARRLALLRSAPQVAGDLCLI